MGRARLRAALTVAVLASTVAVPVVRAREDGSEPEGGREANTSTADDQPADDGTVRPGEARNVAVQDERRGRGWLWIPRIVFALPRFVLMVVTEPAVQLALLQDRHRAYDRIIDFLFNEERTFGIVPLAFFETGFGLNAGVEVLHLDLFGQGEDLRIRAAYGGLFRQIYEARFATGDRLPEGQLLELGLWFERQRDLFFGIGNGDRVDADSVDAAIDPYAMPTAVKTRFGRSELAGQARFTAKPSPVISVQWTYRWRRRWLASVSSSSPKLREVYDPASVVGFTDPLLDVHVETRLRAGRHQVIPNWLPEALPSHGWQLELWAGWQQSFGPELRFAPVGVDLQGFIDLFGGNRVLRLRLRSAAALGRSNEIPFLDLPSLGGPTLLRGYPRDRFRGRLSVLASAEYRYPVLPNLSALLFVDAGRAFRDFDDVSIHDPRVGFGGGMVVHTPASILFRIQLASSIDGGVFVHAQVGPSGLL